ncbi:SGNH/GDSL hydrolase family protein [Pseudomonas asiatica]|uniref:SGNH/GDSL hydrolase family protein n=1 Tax=Pseudomonas asiatica TaxID=2219225 RepID=A0A9X4D3N3_9PSED|nr:SGNH/GDSL hydrolase family protein [Pseudomonas asiatica]MDD2109308.1 SGNH/GDSL hydrolase family protein [Pseudomonas asiatica]
MSIPILPDRVIVLGDSISSGVYEDVGPGDQSKLWVNRLPSLVGASVSNLSSPGQRVTPGGQPGFGIAANLNAISMVSGYSGAKWAIITAGTNDTANYGTGLIEYIECYRSLIAYCRSLGMIVISISPIWRGDVASLKQHVDGVYSFEAFRVYGEMVAYEEKAKPGPAVHVLSGLQAPLLPAHFIEDQVHLNASGHEVFTDWLLGQMRSVGYWCE